VHQTVPNFSKIEQSAAELNNLNIKNSGPTPTLNFRESGFQSSRPLQTHSAYITYTVSAKWRLRYWHGWVIDDGMHFRGPFFRRQFCQG